MFGFRLVRKKDRDALRVLRELPRELRDNDEAEGAHLIEDVLRGCGARIATLTFSMLCAERDLRRIQESGEEEQRARRAALLRAVKQSERLINVGCATDAARVLRLAIDVEHIMEHNAPGPERARLLHDRVQRRWDCTPS